MIAGIAATNADPAEFTKDPGRGLRQFIDRATSSGHALYLRGMPEIAICLKSHPELWRRLEEACQPERRIGADTAPTANDFVQSVERNLHFPRRFDLRQAGGSEEFLE